MQLEMNINRVLKETLPLSWKNIPQPVCQSTQSLLQCTHDLKRFVIKQQQKIDTVTATVSQAAIDLLRVNDDRESKLKSEVEQMEAKLLEVIAKNKE